jgi:hypothetical protein
MRTTVRLDNDLMEQLRKQAHREKVSLTRLLNRAVRAGLRESGTQRRKRTVYRERAHSLGAPRVSLDRALSLAASLEDEEIVRKLAVRK